MAQLDFRRAPKISGTRLDKRPAPTGRVRRWYGPAAATSAISSRDRGSRVEDNARRIASTRGKERRTQIPLIPQIYTEEEHLLVLWNL
jgi:hypothetical protein